MKLFETNKIYTALVALLSLLFVGCVDDLELRKEVPEGSTPVNFQLDFKSFTPALETRTGGVALDRINTLWIAVYKTDGTHVMTKQIEEFTQTAGNGVSFNEIIENGTYRIYAIANHDLGKQMQDGGRDHLTESELRASRMVWDEKDVTKNAQMFGWFQSGTSTDVSQPDLGGIPDVIPPVTIGGDNTRLHAWLRRCASKVTVAYDGTGLHDGVEIYLTGVSIKDIPLRCFLGYNNDNNEEAGIMHKDSLIHDGERFLYHNGEFGVDANKNITLPANYPALITNAKGKGKTTYGSDHSDSAEALFFYENLQGTGKDKSEMYVYVDEDETLVRKNGKDFGTYIEVEGIYRVTQTFTVTTTTKKPDGTTVTKTEEIKPEIGVVRYRFMLGQNITTDYNALRNHHYKLTLVFNGTARNFDWQVDFQDPVLEVDDPVEFDYRGKIFSPDWSIPNGGHEFVEGNEIDMIHFPETYDGVQITYEYIGDESDWLTIDQEATKKDLPYETHLVFKAKEQTPQELDLDKLLQDAPTKGTTSQPWNLANPSEGASKTPANATIQNTANCYVVDAPGVYMLPLVYGNGVQNGVAWNASNPDNRIPSGFKNSFDKAFASAYIKDDYKAAKNVSTFPDAKTIPSLVWEDENNLIDWIYWEGHEQNRIKYDKNAYGGKGGIIFTVDKSSIKQGNAVLSIWDGEEYIKASNTANMIVWNYSPHIYWSWHIWFTPFLSTDKIDQSDYTIPVTDSDNSKVYNLLSINLGWCSPTNQVLKYYPERRCKVSFRSSKGIVTKEFVQKSHISVPCGNNPYYQWGRKDPFGPLKSGIYVSDDPNFNVDATNNKYLYISKDWAISNSPNPLSGSFGEAPEGGPYDQDHQKTKDKNTDRKTTKEALADLIKYPQKWHNPKVGGYGGDYGFSQWFSYNEVYSYQWGDFGEGTNVKTIYDPCPVGYRVPTVSAFNGFTVNGQNTNNSDYWMNVEDKNILDLKDPSDGTKNSIYATDVYEFYTNLKKTQSIVLPVNGYRDWDNSAIGAHYGIIGYLWTASQSKHSNPLIDWIHQFEFIHPRNAGLSFTGKPYVHPKNAYLSCDGFPIRPVKE